MNKVICDICGTSYPDTAEQCPICGYSRDLGTLLGDEIQIQEQPATQVSQPVKGGRFSASNVRKRNQSTPAYESQTDDGQDDEADEALDQEYDQEPRQSSAVLVVLLVIVITALLAASAYIAVKYIVPNVLVEETVPTTEMTEPITEPVETEEPTVPCTSLVLTSGGTAVLEREGQHWLLNVVILPVDSTDVLTYESSDESVVTVNAEGRVTAVGEGEAVVTIRCGGQALECRIICEFPEETAETGGATEPETT